jgi:hypothetical protein
MLPSPSLAAPWLSLSASPAFGPWGIPLDVGLGVVGAGAGVGAECVVVGGGGGGVVWVGVAATVAVGVAGAAVVCGLLVWCFGCGLAWCLGLWTFGLAATVWVVAVECVDRVGLEEEEDPQPAATAAVRTVARVNLNAVIVVKDAGVRGLLPGNASPALPPSETGGRAAFSDRGTGRPAEH